jgi:hypothetical protein
VYVKCIRRARVWAAAAVGRIGDTVVLVTGTDAGSDERLLFQDAGQRLIGELASVLDDAYGDAWFDWSGAEGRLKVAITTRADPAAFAAAQHIANEAKLAARVDFVRVVWSARELAAAQNRVAAAFDPAPAALMAISVDPAINAVKIQVSDELDAGQLDMVEAAIQAAAVSVRVVVSHGRWFAA